MTAGETFASLVTPILERFFRQNDRPPPPRAELVDLAARLWIEIGRRGLPRPLAPSERGEPGEIADADLAAMMSAVLAAADSSRHEALAGPARQLVKTCFYPEFKTCRDSFREVSPDGSCRRQELARARTRVSGAHCVDCPHWVALTPEQHERYLAREWKSGAAKFLAHREIFLPEDFRALRRFLYRQARSEA